MPPRPLSQQEDITEFSLPNTWGFSLLNLATGENLAVEVCVFIVMHNPIRPLASKKVPSYYVLSRVFICMCMSLSVWIYCFMSAQALICVFSWFNVPVSRESVCVRWNSIWRWADPGVVTCFSAMGRCCDGPLPAGTGGPVSSAFWCEFHLSGDSVKVPVTLGKHMWAP